MTGTALAHQAFGEGAAIVVHGGAGAPQAWDDGCAHAAEAGRAILERGGSALDAAVAAVVAMEADGRFNAGNGAALRIDGSVEMDAAVMDDQGILGAVAGLQDVRHPVLVAREVARTPHWLLVGEGARDFARHCHLSGTYIASDVARQRHAERSRTLLQAWHASPEADAALRRYWNYAVPWQAVLKRWGGGTVGAVVRDDAGHHAVATSTGGCFPALRGRVGDTPIVGCGFFAGRAGAVAVTGVGEYLVRRLLSSMVYHWVESGVPLGTAVQDGIALFPDDVEVGIIAVSAGATAIASNRTLPWAGWVQSPAA